MWAGVVLVAILLFGTIGYILLEKWEPLEALWMTVITMSTVGYQEVEPLDTPGKILTIGIIMASLLVMGYAVGNISAFLIGGEIGIILKGRRLERNIERLSGHVILIGFGALGQEAARSWHDSDLIIIEKDRERFDEAQDQEYIALLGDATHDEVLIRAGIKRANGLMIAIGDVADSVLIALTARELTPDIVISTRVDDPMAESKLRRVGVNGVVLPSQIGGRRLAAYLKHPTIVDFLDLVMKRDDLSLRLEEFRVEPDCKLIGETIGESNMRKESGGALVMSVYKPDGNHVVAPSADYRIQADDVLITLGTDEMLKNVCLMVGSKSGS